MAGVGYTPGWSYIARALSASPRLIQQQPTVMPVLTAENQPDFPKAVERWGKRVGDATLGARSSPFANGTMIASQAFTNGVPVTIPHRLGTAALSSMWSASYNGSPNATVRFDAQNVYVTPGADFTADLWIMPVALAPTGPYGPPSSIVGPTGPTGATGAAAGLYDPYGSRPAAGTSGRLYYPSDPGPIPFLDTGSVWDALIDGVAYPQVPAAANWSNLGAVATFADSLGTILVTPSTVSDTFINYTPGLGGNTTLTASLGQSVRVGGSGNPGFGIAIRNSSVTGGNVGYVRFAYYLASDLTLHCQVQRFTGAGVPATPGAVSIDAGGIPPESRFQWQRLIWDSGTGTVTFQVGNNGIDWVTFNSQTPFQANPTIQIGIVPMTVASAGDNIPRVYSWGLS